jgi:hypothetical protein
MIVRDVRSGIQKLVILDSIGREEMRSFKDTGDEGHHLCINIMGFRHWQTAVTAD